jgi:branched-chain amino acid transport system permease protein
MINTKKVIIFVIILLGLLLPVITHNLFWSVFLGRVMGSILFTTAAWALLEVAGQPVFGISALAGLGVYAFALTAQNGNINPWLAIIIGIIVATFVGMLLSIPSMKIGGIMNQGILNIFFVFAFSAFIAAFSSFTGGTAGVALEILPPTDIFKQLPYKYMIIMIITVIGVGAIYCILKTRVGKIIALTAKNERLASTLGIDITKYKRLAYLIFIPFIALAGFCSSYTTGFTSPSYWSVELSFITILSFWIGGSGSILGPIVGAALISSIPTLFNVAMEWRIVFCGVLALVIRMFLPEGLVGLFSRKPKALGKGIHKKLAIK